MSRPSPRRSPQVPDHACVLVREEDVVHLPELVLGGRRLGWPRRRSAPVGGRRSAAGGATRSAGRRSPPAARARSTRPAAVRALEVAVLDSVTGAWAGLGCGRALGRPARPGRRSTRRYPTRPAAGPGVAALWWPGTRARSAPTRSGAAVRTPSLASSQLHAPERERGDQERDREPDPRDRRRRRAPRPIRRGAGSGPG